MLNQKPQNSLFTIHLLHNYFYDQQGAKALQIKANPETHTLFRKIGLRSKNLKNSVSFHTSEDKFEAFKVFLEDGQDSLLSFLLYHHHPYWLQLTYLPEQLDQLTAILYLSNQNAHPNDLLHQAEYASEKDMLIAGTASLVQANIQKLASLSTPSRDQILSLKQSLKTQKILGWLDIHIKAEVKAEWLQALQKDLPFKSLEYYVQFQTRAVYWRYWIRLAPSEKPENIRSIQVLTEDSSLVFEGPKEIILPDQSLAYVFISNKPIPLYERSPFRFELRLEKKTRPKRELEFGNKKKTGITFMLPVADPKDIHPVIIHHKTQLCADIAFKI